MKRNPLPARGDVLVLAGDVTTFSKMDDCRDFFDYLSDHFKTTYWVPGNHEYYHSDIGEWRVGSEWRVASGKWLVGPSTGSPQ